MISLFITFVIVYIIGTLIGHVAHMTFHKSWSRGFYKSHYVHHFEKYPINDFISDEYRSSGKNNSVPLFIVALLPLILFIYLLHYMNIISFTNLLFVFMEMIIIGWINDSLHTSFHLYKSRWQFLPFYEKLRNLHYMHHADTSKNYGIYSFTWDKVFKSFKQN